MRRGALLAAAALFACNSSTPAPAPPALQAAAGDRQITLSWSAVSGATSYTLYRGTAAGTGLAGTKLAGLTGTSSTDTGLTNGTTYFYVLTASGAWGESRPSNEASETPGGAPQVPAAPASLTATAGNAQVRLTWPAVSGATSYNAYRSQTSGAGKAGTKLANVSSGVVDSTVTNDTTYYYVVAAVGAGGEGAQSPEASATPTALATCAPACDSSRGLSCVSGACVCTGSGATDSCVQSSTGVCSAGACVACGSCPTGFTCNAGVCQTALYDLAEQPEPRYGSEFVYDSAGARFVLASGFGVPSNGFPDVWTIPADGSAWTLISVTGTELPVSATHTIVDDPAGNRLINYDGTKVLAFDLNDPSAGWQTLTTSGTAPGAREQHGCVYDSVGHRVIVFGGETIAYYPQIPQYLNEVWALDLGVSPPAWSQLHPANPPTGRTDHMMAYDAGSNSVIFFGGFEQVPCGGNCVQQMTDTWQLTLGTTPAWTQLAQSSATDPGQLEFAAAFVVPGSPSTFALFGGNLPNSGNAAQNAVWTLPLDTQQWSTLSVASPPPARAQANVAWDPVNARLAMFGGNTDELWFLELGATPAWTQARPNLASPADTQAVWDEVNGRMVSFGGRFGFVTNTTPMPHNETIVARSRAWSVLDPSPGTPPSARMNAAVALDEPRHRMIVFSGLSAPFSPAPNDLWQLTFADSQWTQLDAGGASAPAARGGACLVADESGKLVLFGGRGSNALFDVWTWDPAPNGPWVSVSPGGTAPSGRDKPFCVWDTDDHGLLVYGGFNGAGQPLGDAFLLQLGATPSWTPLHSGGTPLAGGAAVWDAPRHRALIAVTSSTDPRLSAYEVHTDGTVAPLCLPTFPDQTFGSSAWWGVVPGIGLAFAGGLPPANGSDPALFGDTMWALPLVTPRCPPP